MNKKIKLGIISTALDGRRGMGTALYTKNIIEYLIKYHRDQFDISLIHYQQPPSSRLPIYDQVKEIIIPFYKLPVFSHAFSESLFFLKKHLNLDIIHYPRQRVYPGFIFSSSSKRVVTIHDAGTWRLNSKAPLANFVYNRTLKWFRKKIDGVITVSDFAKKEVNKYYKFPLDKIFVQYLGVNDIYKKVEVDRQSIESFKSKYGINNKFFLNVSRLQPHKNVKNLILAYKRLNDQKYSNYQLVIAGAHSWQTEEIKKLINDLGFKEKVLSPGYVPDDDLLLFYNLAEMLVFPSLHEGFGFPVVEAMSCGCPVITSNMTSLPEIAGKAAILVDPKEPEQISQAIIKLLTNPQLKQELIDKGIKHSREFNWERSLEKLVKYYNEIYYGSKTK